MLYLLRPPFDAAPQPKPTLLADYASPDFLIATTRLDVQIHADHARVHATLQLRRNPAGPRDAPLVLDGEQEVAHLVLDGADVFSLELSGALVVKGNLDLVIGTWFKQNQAFCGELDSIRIWKRALSADELVARAARVTAAG